MTNKKSTPSNSNVDSSFLSGMINQLRLVWSLFTDKRVPLWTKLIILISFVYLISPVDFVPGFLLGFGQMDDLGVILLGMALFVKLCPPHIVEHYRHQIEYGSDNTNQEMIDTTYRVIDED